VETTHDEVGLNGTVHGDAASGVRLALRPLEPRDYEALFRIETDPLVHQTYRLAGRTPTPDRYVELLWSGVEIHLVLVDASNDVQAFGSAALYNWSPSNQTAYAAIVVARSVRGQGIAMVAMARFVDHCFLSLPLRKVYFEATDSTIAQFAGGLASGLLTREAELKNHTYVAGHFESHHILSIEREHFYGSRIARRYIENKETDVWKD
jgi:RimJ/RimL family protein N-acetyltransferase